MSYSLIQIPQKHVLVWILTETGDIIGANLVYPTILALIFTADLDPFPNTKVKTLKHTSKH